MRLTPMLLLASLAGGLTPSAFGAEPTWHPGLMVSPPKSGASSPAAALTSGGQAVAAWTATVRGRQRIQVRSRRGFVRPWRVEWTSGGYRGPLRAPAVGANAAGAAVVIWRVPGGPVRSVVRRSRTGRWRVIPVPSRRPDRRELGTFQTPEVAVGADGSAAAVWVARERGDWSVRGARRGRSGRWVATPALAADRGAAWAPIVHVNTSGDAVAVWIVSRPGTEAQIVPTGSVRVATRRANGAWAAPVTLGETENGADVAIDSNGRIAAAWSIPSPTGDGDEVVLARTDAAGVWSAPEAVGPGSTPRIAMNDAGAIVAAWAGPADAPGGRTPLRAAVNHGSGWSPPATLVASESVTPIEVSESRVAMSAAGRAFLAWVDPLGPGAATAAVLSAGADGAFTGFSEGVGADDPGIALAPDDAGNALALYPKQVATPPASAIFAASYDRVPRPVVTADAHARWLARRTGIRWTVTVRNRGPVAARGVRLTASVCCGNRLVASRPRSEALSSRTWRWRLGTLRPGAARRVLVVTRPNRGVSGPRRLFGGVTAIGLPPSGIEGAVFPGE